MSKLYKVVVVERVEVPRTELQRFLYKPREFVSVERLVVETDEDPTFEVAEAMREHLDSTLRLDQTNDNDTKGR